MENNELPAIIDKETGEVMQQIQTTEKQIVDLYRGASTKAVTSKQQEVLLTSVDPMDVEIKPDGPVYLPQVKYRRRLNLAFGPMGWALLPADELRMKGNIMYRKYVLLVGDRYVAEAIGDQKYFENNENMSYADAAEGVKSNALERCCKDLGIASELWDPGWTTQWKQEHAVQVMAPHKGQMKKMWRRKDRPPFEGEGGQITKPETITNNPQSQQSDQIMFPHKDDHLISDAQRRRLYAIARNNGCSDDKFKKELEKMGYKSSNDVPKSSYEDVCSFFEALT